MTGPVQRVFFQAAGPGRQGQRLYALHTPAPGEPIRGAFLYVHPFAEEMNKARRMSALQARELARMGYAVLRPDLLGCGDSSGDFGDATWAEWTVDVVEAWHWLNARFPGEPWLWGLRAGALLACAAAACLPQRCHFVFWQPAVSGRQLLQQFLRLKAAGGLLDGGTKGVVETLRRQVGSGRAVDVAGYRLHPALAEGLESATLAPPQTDGVRVEWLELQPGGGDTLSPAAAQAAQTWQRAGAAVRAQVVRGPAFWQTTEIEDAPELLDATCRAMLAPDGTARRAGHATHVLPETTLRVAP